MTNQTTGTRESQRSRQLPRSRPMSSGTRLTSPRPNGLSACTARTASVEDTLAWQRWLNESPSHAEAFARIEEVSQALRSVPPPAAVTANRLASDRYDASIPLKDWKEPEAARLRWLTLALAAACAGIVVSVVFWKTAPPNTFTTAVGENRVITLGDGSTDFSGRRHTDRRGDVGKGARHRALEGRSVIHSREGRQPGLSKYAPGMRRSWRSERRSTYSAIAIAPSSP